MKTTSKGPPVEPFKVRGVIYERATTWGRVVQKWPRRRGRATSGYDLYRQLEFGYVARFISAASIAEQETARFWVKGTDFVWRDMLMQLAMGKGFEIIDADGNVWQSWRVTNPNPQLILDLVGNTPGALLYRHDVGWIILPPGNAQDVLTLTPDGFPSWAPPAGGGGGSGWTSLPFSTTSFGAGWATSELYEAGSPVPVAAGDVLEYRVSVDRPHGHLMTVALSPDGNKAAFGAVQNDDNWVSYYCGSLGGSPSLLRGGTFTQPNVDFLNVVTARLQIGTTHHVFSVQANGANSGSADSLKTSTLTESDLGFIANGVARLFVGFDTGSGIVPVAAQVQKW